MPVTNLVDGLITFRILKMLVTPFTSTDAYKFGIIDKDGTPLKKSKDLKSPEEQASYTMLWRLVFKLKRILAKIPFVNKNLVNFAAALWLIKECNERGVEPENMEELYEAAMKEDLTESVKQIHAYQRTHPSFELWKVINEEGVGGGGVPANNVSSGHIAGIDGNAAGPRAPRLKRFNDIRKKKVT